MYLLSTTFTEKNALALVGFFRSRLVQVGTGTLYL